MSKSFLIFSQDKSEAVKLHAKLLGVGCKVQIVESLVSAYERTAQGNIDCFVLDLKDFDANSLHIVRNVRTRNALLPVLVLTTKAQREAMALFRESKQVVVLEKPYSCAELQKLCEKIITGEEIYHREHKRFSLDVPISVAPVDSKKLWNGRMYNISKGGAYVEINEGALMSGDILLLNIDWGEGKAVSQQSTVQAEVIWASKGKSKNSTVKAGFRFVTPENVNISFL